MAQKNPRFFFSKSKVQKNKNVLIDCFYRNIEYTKKYNIPRRKERENLNNFSLKIRLELKI